MRFHFKIMSPEITAPLFVSPRCIPLSLRLAAKVLSGRKNLLQQIPIGDRNAAQHGADDAEETLVGAAQIEIGK